MEDKLDIPPTPTSFRMIHPLIRFRVAAIAVIAGNRLRFLREQSNLPMFVCDESPVSENRVVVVSGQPEKMSPRTNKKSSGFDIKSRSDIAVEWLSNSELIHSVRDATTGVVDAVLKNSGDTSGYMSKAVVKTAKAAFVNLMEATYPKFPSYMLRPRNLIRERSALCTVLGNGLDRVINVCNLREAVNVFSSENSISCLQSHLLTFTSRLHAAEVEKRNLRNGEVRLRMSMDKLKDKKNELEEKVKEIDELRANERNLVERERFNGVCLELENALEREKKAQRILLDQSDKLQDLNARYQQQSKRGEDKERTLNHAVTDLNALKLELKRTSTAKRQIEKQLDRVQQERNKLTSQVEDAKAALKKAAGEKHSIANYFATVEKTLQQNGSDDDIPDKLRYPTSDGQVGPGLQAAHRTVETFVRAQSTAVSRISNLESQISSYRNHISTLKRELHDACQREIQLDDFDLAETPTKENSPRIISPISDKLLRDDVRITSTPSSFHQLEPEMISGQTSYVQLQPRPNRNYSRKQYSDNSKF